MEIKEEEIIKESVPIGHCKPIGKKELLNLFEIGENSLVKIYSNEKCGTGFICKIKDKDLNFSYGLFTNNHVLGEEEIEEGEKISFEYKNESRYIKLNADRKTFTDKIIDYTFIEIKKTDNFDDYFLIDDNIIDDNYIDKDIIILQFPLGNEISFAQGKLKKIQENNIIHTTPTEHGSSGSPLIIRKNVQKYYVIGLHYGSIKKENINLGRHMKYIFDDIKNKMKIIKEEENIKKIKNEIEGNKEIRKKKRKKKSK